MAWFRQFIPNRFFRHGKILPTGSASHSPGKYKKPYTGILFAGAVLFFKKNGDGRKKREKHFIGF